LQFGIVFNAATQPWLQLIRTADACHQWHAVHIFRVETNLEPWHGLNHYCQLFDFFWVGTVLDHVR
jgi:hypothetical protein